MIKGIMPMAMTIMTAWKHTAAKRLRYPTPIALDLSSAKNARQRGLAAALRYISPTRTKMVVITQNKQATQATRATIARSSRIKEVLAWAYVRESNESITCFLMARGWDASMPTDASAMFTTLTKFWARIYMQAQISIACTMRV